MKLFKKVPCYYQFSGCETGAVVYENRLWFIIGDDKSIAMKKLLDPLTGEVRLVDFYEECYWVIPEFEIKPQIKGVQVEPEGGFATMIHLPLEDQMLTEISGKNFMLDVKSTEVYRIKEVGTKVVCYNIMTGEELVLDPEHPVSPVQVNITVTPYLSKVTFQPEDWEAHREGGEPFWTDWKYKG